MLVEFDSIPEDAKVWIYPSSRKFYANEIDEVEQKVKNFVKTWKTDSENFKASYKILHNRFIVLAADHLTTTLSNKDIDASVAFILELQETYKVALLDKMNVCFKQGKYIQYKELKDFKKLLKNKAITAKTIIFDNLIATKQEFENHWQVAIEDSWYGRFLR
ncbi:ABC transporter ATPase [Polaribacter batillariae]|uniref:ABC transporter ATPase n=1 Tax=Polaribacter batillariae TaxID=2808900 RepID=A0ABX7SWX1_9FLAO|nr:ABC transporter ATPase [Polaribacter batillariae]QTD38765.1 ABC transporter ATPase [Polaribacter batillariae]